VTDWQAVAASISAATGDAFQPGPARPLGGGCINEAVCLEGAGRRYFVKLNEAGKRDMFEAEAAGLAAILASGTLHAPRPVALGDDGRRSWLVLEYLELGSAGRASAALGEQLAAMHRHTAEHFGWHRDNCIGTTAQVNTPSADWVDFFARQRLGYQLDLAARNGAPRRLVDAGRTVQAGLGAFFSNYRPAPSLLHGDLWGGNWGTDATGRPVVFDPAVYHGDREADLAMTELFGGFDDRFYHSYVHTWAIDPGYATRKVLYNLYHVLNHFNLFGGGYAAQARDMADRLVAEIS